jgi:hypothetical protein
VRRLFPPSLWCASRGRSSVGRALASQARCRGFESRRPLHGKAPQTRGFVILVGVQETVSDGAAYEVLADRDRQLNSWSALAWSQQDAPQSLTLLVCRPVGTPGSVSGQFQVVAKSEPQTLAYVPFGYVLKTFRVAPPIALQAGDVLGFYTAAPPSAPLRGCSTYIGPTATGNDATTGLEKSQKLVSATRCFMRHRAAANIASMSRRRFVRTAPRASCGGKDDSHGWGGAVAPTPSPAEPRRAVPSPRTPLSSLPSADQAGSGGTWAHRPSNSRAAYSGREHDLQSQGTRASRPRNGWCISRTQRRHQGAVSRMQTQTPSCGTRRDATATASGCCSRCHGLESECGLTTEEDIGTVARQLADLTQLVEAMAQQVAGLVDRSEEQQRRSDIQQDSIELAARELADVSERIQAAADALRQVI